MGEKYQDKMSYIGNKILVNSRNELYLSMRFFDLALNSLSYEINLSTVTIGTDGEKILYHPNYLISKYQDDKVLVNRMYIHMLLHCIFRHMMYDKQVDIEIWNIACDIAVESIIDGMDYKSIHLTVSDERNRMYNELHQELKVLTAEGIYHVLIKRKLSYGDIKRYDRMFRCCDHSIWLKLKDKKKDTNGNSKESSQENSSENKNENLNEKSADNSNAHSSEKSNDKSSNESSIRSEEKEKKESSTLIEEYVPSNMDEELKENWKDISDKVKSNIESLGRNIKEEASVLLESLQVENRERYDYKHFLRKFAIKTEEIQVDLDSFDYIYYTYGLTHYDNMPLIEPLEYKEVNKIQEFIIVLDTSGSCSKDLIMKFLHESYKILTTSGSFHKKVNLYIIQCDEKVQSSVCIRTKEELEEYIKTFEILGQGGTDFRKAFEYINSLLEENVFHSLKGMLYFTDGQGIYPNKRPKYDVAFVFLEEQYRDVKVPTWALKLIIEPGGLMDEH